MATTRGNCINVDYCGLAAARHPVSVAVGEAFACPECASPLRAPTIRPSQGFTSLAVAGFFAAVILVGVGIYIGSRLSGPALPLAAAFAAAAPPPPSPKLAFDPPASAFAPALSGPDRLLPQQVVALTPARPDPAILLRLQGAAALGTILVPRLAAAFLSEQGDVSVAAYPGEVPGDLIVAGLRAGRPEGIAIDLGSDSAGLAAVAASRADIAMTTRRIAPDEQRRLQPLGDPGPPADAHEVARNATGEEMFFYTSPGHANPLAQRFVAFAQSADGQAAVARAGLLPIQPIGLPASGPSARDRYLELTGGATRLSADLHFEPNSNRLDLRSARDVDRIWNVMLSDHTPPDRLIVIGFADNQGTPQANLALGQQRARAVAAVFADRGLPPGQVVSFGSDLPVGDNGTADGREQNRRVELFLRN